jgi:hypothetical protein
MKVFVEVYATEAPDAVGITWDGTPELDADTLAWLEEVGVTTDHPHRWVNLVPAAAWTPNNRPAHQRETTVEDTPALLELL